MSLAHKYHPAFIIMDYHLPGITGLDAISVIRCILPEVPVILLTGDKKFTRTATTMNTDTLAILTKPFPIESIGQFIRNRLDDEADDQNQDDEYNGSAS